MRLALMVENLAGKGCHLHEIYFYESVCLWTHINVNPWPQLQLRSPLFHLPEMGGRGDLKLSKVHGTWAFYRA